MADQTRPELPEGWDYISDVVEEIEEENNFTDMEKELADSLSDAAFRGRAFTMDSLIKQIAENNVDPYYCNRLEWLSDGGYDAYDCCVAEGVIQPNGDLLGDIATAWAIDNEVKLEDRIAEISNYAMFLWLEAEGVERLDIEDFEPINYALTFEFDDAVDYILDNWLDEWVTPDQESELLDQDKPKSQSPSLKEVAKESKEASVAMAERTKMQRSTKEASR